jgi:ABC-type multidrug transport system ATPase subunit
LREVCIETHGVRRTFENKEILKGVEFSMQTSECLGILGAHSSGKSTLVSLLYLKSEPSAGDVFVLGVNTKSASVKLRPSIGLIPQGKHFIPGLNVLENIYYHALFFGMSADVAHMRATEVVKDIGIEALEHQSIGELDELGIKCVQLARSMVTDPSVIIFDEPFENLDYNQALQFIEKIEYLKGLKRSVLILSSYAQHLEQLCERVGFLDSGKIVEIGKPSELRDKLVGRGVSTILIL